MTHFGLVKSVIQLEETWQGDPNLLHGAEDKLLVSFVKALLATFLLKEFDEECWEEDIIKRWVTECYHIEGYSGASYLEGNICLCFRILCQVR